MIRDAVRCASLLAMVTTLAACGLVRIPLDAPREPIRIEATVILKHEYILSQTIEPGR